MRNVTAKKIRRSKKGTTLVELIVSLTLTAMFAVICVALINPIERVYQRTEKIARAQLLADTIVDSIRKECDGIKNNDVNSVWIADGSFDAASASDQILFDSSCDKRIAPDKEGTVLVLKKNNSYCEMIFASLPITEANKSAANANTLDDTYSGHAVDELFSGDVAKNTGRGVVHFGYYGAGDKGNGVYPLKAYDYTNPVVSSTYGDYYVKLYFKNLITRTDPVGEGTATFPSYLECEVRVYEGEYKAGKTDSGLVYTRTAAISFSANGSRHGTSTASDPHTTPDDKKNVKVTVLWDDNNNASNRRPAKVTIKLMNGDNQLASREISTNRNPYTFTFANVKNVSVTVEQDPKAPDGYKMREIKKVNGGFLITNKANSVRLISGPNFNDVLKNKVKYVTSIRFGSEAELKSYIPNYETTNKYYKVSINDKGEITDDYKLYYVNEGTNNNKAYVISKDGAFLANEDCHNMFANCGFLQNITWTDSSNHFVIETSGTTNMSSMFLNCTSMKQFNVLDLVQSSCTNISSMFSGCTKAEECNFLNTWNTSGVTDMSSMFYNFGSSIGDKQITIDVSGFDFSSCLSLNKMFSGCGATSIAFPEMTDAKTKTINNIDYMFQGCKRLSTISNILVNAATSNDSALSDATHVCFNGVTSVNYVFDGCTELKNIRLWISMSGCTSVKSIIANCPNLYSVDLSGSDFSSIKQMVFFIYNCGELHTVLINDHASFKSFTGEPTGNQLPSFEKCDKLSRLEMKDADLRSVTNAAFIGRRSLTYLDLSGAVMTSYTNINKLFSYTNKDFYLEYVDFTGTQFGNYDSAYQMFIHCKNIKKVKGFKFPSNCSEAFKTCNATTKITFENCDGSAVTSMSNMFNGCTALTSVDMGNFKAPNLTNCQSLFENCSNLDIKADIFLDWDATGITNLSNIYKNCPKMGSSSGGIIDFSGLNLSSCLTMQGAFYGCTSLKTLKMNNVNLKSCSNYTDMISNCPDLYNVEIKNSDLTAITGLRFLNVVPYLDLSGSTIGIEKAESSFASSNNSKVVSVKFTGAKLPNCTSVKQMFSGCSTLTYVDFSGVTAPNLANCQRMFENCTELDVSTDKIFGWNTSSVTDMSYILKGCTKMGSSSSGLINISDMNLGSCLTMQGAFYGCTSIKTLKLNNFDLKSCTTFTDLIAGCSDLTDLTIKNSDLTAAASLAFMKPAKNIDISGSTFGLTSLANAFKDANKIETINLSGAHFKNCTSFAWMFMSCKNLTTVRADGLDTPILNSCEGMFQNCYSLNLGNFGNWDTSSVTTMKRMFYYACYRGDGYSDLPRTAVIDLSGLKFTNVADFDEMFNLEDAYRDNDALNKVVLPYGDGGKDYANTVKTRRMFRNRKYLEYIDNLAYFSIEKAVNETTSMFAACGVKELNISSLDMSKIGAKKGQWMFNNCSNLVKIYVAPGTVYDNLAISGDTMFHCDNNGTCPLTGGKGTPWSNSTDKGLYCRVDDPDNGKPGYFSVAPTT